MLINVYLCVGALNSFMHIMIHLMKVNEDRRKNVQTSVHYRREHVGIKHSFNKYCTLTHYIQIILPPKRLFTTKIQSGYIKVWSWGGGGN